MWPFKRRIAMQFEPALLDLGDPHPFRVKTDNEAMNALLYSQAVSLKRIADSLHQIEFYQSEQLGIANAQFRNH